jgi:hypothetical protein
MMSAMIVRSVFGFSTMVRSQAITVFPFVGGDRRMRIRRMDFRRARGRCQTVSNRREAGYDARPLR